LSTGSWATGSFDAFRLLQPTIRLTPEIRVLAYRDKCLVGDQAFFVLVPSSDGLRQQQQLLLLQQQHDTDVFTQRLSLNHLKQGESHQRIRHSAQELLRLTESFSGFNGSGPDGGYDKASDNALPTDSDLRTMSKLSHGIAREIGEIMALKKCDSAQQHSWTGSQQHQQKHQFQLQYDGQPGGAGHAPDYASTAARKSRRKIDFSCHKCHRVDTPEWRPGPDGPSTLCNVCGLIYAKRERKKEGSTMPTFGSPNFS
ncbi:GATA zinc finger domain-containing protein 7, partial [Colletotrichum chlorophyti]